ncbi:unnamed protein product [Cunninghamella blakesleeana]
MSSTIQQRHIASPFHSPHTRLPRRLLYNSTSEPLNIILEELKAQVQSLDNNIKWKIELIIDEDHTYHSPDIRRNHSPVNSLPSSPYQNDTGSFSTISLKESLISISSRIQYPWHFVTPTTTHEPLSKQTADDLQSQLKDAVERQKYLEHIIHSQSEQIKRTCNFSDTAEDAIATMRNVFLAMENEQKLRYSIEAKLLQKEIEMLDRKAKNLTNILHTIENMQSTTDDMKADKETLLEEKKQLLRKLHLAELRLSARDAEMDYLQHQNQLLSKNNHNDSRSSPDINKSAHRSPTPQFARKGPPYLFQQQYSPKMRSNVRPTTPQRHSNQKLSGLDSLGILADQMLSDPDFEHNKGSPTLTSASSPLKHSTTLLTTSSSSSTTTTSHPSFHQTVLKRQKSNLSTSSSSPSYQHHYSSPSFRSISPDVNEVHWNYSNNNSESSISQKQKQRSKRSIDSANALLSIPMLSSSFDPISEKQENDIVHKRTKLYNVTTWTPNEDEQLRKMVLIYGTANKWDNIADKLQGRSSQQCQQRWAIIQSSTTTKKTNTPEPSTHLNARHSPSIAALLDQNSSNESNQCTYDYPSSSSPSTRFYQTSTDHNSPSMIYQSRNTDLFRK